MRTRAHRLLPLVLPVAVLLAGCSPTSSPSGSPTSSSSPSDSAEAAPSTGTTTAPSAPTSSAEPSGAAESPFSWRGNWDVEELVAGTGETAWSEGRLREEAPRPQVRVRGGDELATVGRTATLRVHAGDGCEQQDMEVDVRVEAPSRLQVLEVRRGARALARCAGPSSGLDLDELVDVLAAGRTWRVRPEPDSTSPRTTPAGWSLVDRNGTVRLLVRGFLPAPWPTS